MMKRILALLLVCCFLIGSAAAAGGSGTEANPYRIQTVAELQSMQNNLGAHYILMNDIDLNGVTWTPIGTSTAGFYGVLDGNGKTISNLQISSTTQYVGFFGKITSGATVKDVIFQDCLVTSTNPYMSVVVGVIDAPSSNPNIITINNVDCVRCGINTNSIYSGLYCGNIVGYSFVEIIGCDIYSAYITSSASRNVGVIGSIQQYSNVNMGDCSVINTSIDAGNGLSIGVIGNIGTINNVSITDVDIGNSIIKSSNSNVGGLIGTLSSITSINIENISVDNCIISGLNNVAGIIAYSGYTFGDDDGSIIIATHCIVSNTTIVASNNNVGGIAGSLHTINTNVFNECIVSDCTIISKTNAAGICPTYARLN